MRSVSYLLYATAFFFSLVMAKPASIELSTETPKTATTSRLDKIKSMYAFEGFVYALDLCPSESDLVSDFKKMRAKGARNVITFDYCGTGDDASYYEQVISAAGTAGLNIIPLAWTLLIGNQTFKGTSVPKIQAVTEAVIRNPDPVLAVALGDEPLYDNDAGSATNLLSYVLEMKSNFSNAGLSDIPISISELAYGWQSTPGNITALAAALDFFMINNFPYFAFDAESGGSATSWSDFMTDITYYESISNGKPLLVTQTGWPTNEDEYAPNSADVVASVSSSHGYWSLLDSHCVDFFKAKNIGWMWRSWNDVIEGWGVVYSNGTEKWDFSAKLTC